MQAGLCVIETDICCRADNVFVCSRGCKMQSDFSLGEKSFDNEYVNP